MENSTTMLSHQMATQSAKKINNAVETAEEMHCRGAVSVKGAESLLITAARRQSNTDASRYEEGFGTATENAAETELQTAVNPATGPRARLLAWPPKLESLPENLFSDDEKKKIRSMREFFDFLPISEINGEELKVKGDYSERMCGGNSEKESTDDVSVAVSRSRVFHRNYFEKYDRSRSRAGDRTLYEKRESQLLGSTHLVAEQQTERSKFKEGEFMGAVLEDRKTCSTVGSSNQITTAATTSSSWLSSWSFGFSKGKATSLQQQDTTAAESTPEEEEFSLTWEEALWLEDDLILARYLRSYDWNEGEAQQQLLQTLKWRQRRRPARISPEKIKHYAKKGSIYRKGFDIHGRGVVYFKPARECSMSSYMFQQHAFYTLERALASLPRDKGIDQLVLIVDFSGCGLLQMSGADLPRELANLLSYHYTDILATAYIVNAPALFDSLWRLLSFILLPETTKKVCFVCTKLCASCSSTISGFKSSRERISGSKAVFGYGFSAISRSSSRASGRESNGDNCADAASLSGSSCVGGCSSLAATTPATTGNSTVHRIDYSSGSKHSDAGKCTCSAEFVRLRQQIPSVFLEQSIGGECDIDYIHDIYWEEEEKDFLLSAAHFKQQQLALQAAVQQRRSRRQREAVAAGDAALAKSGSAEAMD